MGSKELCLVIKDWAITNALPQKLDILSNVSSYVLNLPPPRKVFLLMFQLMILDNFSKYWEMFLGSGKVGPKTVWGGLTNSCEKKRSKKQRRKGKIYPFECRVPKNRKERQESLPQWSVQRKRKIIQWERLEISSRKLEIPREYFMQRWAQ